MHNLSNKKYPPPKKNEKKRKKSIRVLTERQHKLTLEHPWLLSNGAIMIEVLDKGYVC